MVVEEEAEEEEEVRNLLASISGEASENFDWGSRSGRGKEVGTMQLDLWERIRGRESGKALSWDMGVGRPTGRAN